MAKLKSPLVAYQKRHVVVAGVWVTGAALTEDATVAMVLTGVWFATAGGLAVLAGLHWRCLAVPVVASWLAASMAVGGFLLLTSTVHRVVDEDVVTVPSASGSPSPATGGEPTTGAATAKGPEALSTGRFSADVHPTWGRATLVEKPGGVRALTLTRFETDPGPDLRVYLVPGDGSSVRGALDLGALKGNKGDKGDQQYDVPADAPDGAVVIWCRALSVAFGTPRWPDAPSAGHPPADPLPERGGNQRGSDLTVPNRRRPREGARGCGR